MSIVESNDLTIRSIVQKAGNTRHNAPRECNEDHKQKLAKAEVSFCSAEVVIHCADFRDV